MTTVTVRIPTPLRSYTQGADEVHAVGTTVGEAMRALGDKHDGLLERVLTSQGEPRQFVNIYLGSRNVRTLEGMATPVSEGDVISIVPAVAGGGA
jgi:molybdopterin converting factor small subunit